MPLACVHNFAISLDGFGTGAGQSADAHFGHAGDRLHQWMFATRCAGGSPAAAVASTTSSSSGTIRASAPRSWVPGSGATPGGTRTRGGRARGAQPVVPPPVFVLTPTPSRWRAARRSTSSTHHPPTHSTLPARPRAARTPDRRRPHRPRVPHRGAGRPRAHRRRRDRARPRRTPLGRVGGPRGGLLGRGRLRTERRHARHLHPQARLNRRTRQPGVDRYDAQEETTRSCGVPECRPATLNLGPHLSAEWVQGPARTAAPPALSSVPCRAPVIVQGLSCAWGHRAVKSPRRRRPPSAALPRRVTPRPLRVIKPRSARMKSVISAGAGLQM